jgi:hypothetical protein
MPKPPDREAFLLVIILLFIVCLSQEVLVVRLLTSSVRNQPSTAYRHLLVMLTAGGVALRCVEADPTIGASRPYL